MRLDDRYYQQPKLNIQIERNSKSKQWFNSLTKSFKIRKKDLPFALVAIAALIYFTIHDPLFVSVLGCSSIVLMSLWHIVRAIPIVEKFIGTRISFWHICVLILTSTMLLSQFESPAHAVFLAGLEDSVTTLLSDSGITIAANAVKATFNLIRIIFLLLVAAAGVFAFNQAQQGNDWRPVIGQIAIAFAVVIAIDLMTYIITGT
jgi:hypothetical protein